MSRRASSSADDRVRANDALIRLGWAGLAAAALVVLATSPFWPRHSSAPDNEAFVWQLRWSPSVSRAVGRDADLFTTWHVLAAELPCCDRPTRMVDVDWRAVMAGGHRAVPVVRVEGTLSGARADQVLHGVLALAAGLPPGLRALEVDHDAGTARLAEYAAFLRRLRAALPAGTTLSATALPAWLGSPDLPLLAGAADRLVLQLHALDDPRLGLFRPERAAAFVQDWARRTATPFLVALPAYSVRVSGAAGALTVASETPVLDGQAGAEVAADPRTVARFAAALRRTPPDGLRGIAWFRLPVDGDARAWSAGTLRRAARGELAAPLLSVSARTGRVPGTADIVVANEGEDDAPLPGRIALPRGCAAADGLGQYGIDGNALALRGGGLLPAHGVALAGWMRCAAHGDEGLRAAD